MGAAPGVTTRSTDLGRSRADLGRSRLLSTSLGTTAQLAAGPSVCTGPSTGHAFSCAMSAAMCVRRLCDHSMAGAVLSLPLSPRLSLCHALQMHLVLIRGI